MPRAEPWQKFRPSQNGIFAHTLTARWFALQVKPRHDKAVAELLEQRDIPSFLPLYACRRRWSDRVRTVQMPLFPGYVFAMLDPGRRTPVLSTPGVLRLVGAGPNPVSIPDCELAAIASAANSGSPCEPLARMEIGQKIRVLSGPLRGQEGVLVNMGNKNRLVLSISLLGRSVAVDILSDWVLEHSSGNGGASPCNSQSTQWENS